VVDAYKRLFFPGQQVEYALTFFPVSPCSDDRRPDSP